VNEAKPASAAPSEPETGLPDDGIDESILHDILQLSDDGGADLLRELIAIFFAEAPARLDHLRGGIVEGDPSRVNRAAHAMKGGAANIGASRLAGLCGQLEKQARGGHLDGAAAAVGQIEIELQRVHGALARWVAALVAPG